LSRRSFRNWLSFATLFGIFKNRKYSYLVQEISSLHSLAVSEFARIKVELRKLHERTVPELERLGKEFSALHNHAISEIARIDAELGKVRDQGDVATARASGGFEVPRGNGSRDIDHVRDEQSRLHGLVTARLAPQLEYLNRELYALKRELYHPGGMPDEQALNGQFSKHLIFGELCAVFSFQSFVETGANVGSTTWFFCRQGKPVYAVEAARGFYDRAQDRLRNEAQAHLALGNSSEFLYALVTMTLAKDDLAFFYLDAHWGDHLPLAEELDIIATHHPHAVVMIDDFKIEDDAGYGYDSYGGKQEITLAFLDDELRKHHWEVFFPAMPSTHDHMITDILPPRGTAVTSCDTEIVGMLRQIRSLRYWPSHSE
jgi:hypothetical protein